MSILIVMRLTFLMDGLKGRCLSDFVCWIGRVDQRIRRCTRSVDTSYLHDSMQYDELRMLLLDMHC